MKNSKQLINYLLLGWSILCEEQASSLPKFYTQSWNNLNSFTTLYLTFIVFLSITSIIPLTIVGVIEKFSWSY